MPEKREKRNIARTEIINYMLNHSVTSKAELAKELGLSMPTVLTNVNELIAKGLIVENGEYASTGGRKAKSIGINREYCRAMGLVITANHLEMVLVNLGYEIEHLKRVRLKFSPDIDYSVKIAGQKCVEARAALTPDRLNKRQNGRRFKEDGEPEFTLTTIDRHGVMMLQCPYYTGLPIKEATKKGYVMARHGDGINLSYPDSDYRRGRVGKQCSQTLLTGANMGVLVYCRIRKLTPKECFRLQAFDDFLFDRAKAAGVSDAQLYKQAGNSVTVNIVYEIGVRLKKMEGCIHEI